jgi:hypothetical protein
MILPPLESPSNSLQLSFSGSNRVFLLHYTLFLTHYNHFLLQEPGLCEYFAIFSITTSPIIMILLPLESPSNSLQLSFQGSQGPFHSFAYSITTQVLPTTYNLSPPLKTHPHHLQHLLFANTLLFTLKSNNI